MTRIARLAIVLLPGGTLITLLLTITRDQWRHYFPDESYRLTCPALGEPKNF